MAIKDQVFRNFTCDRKGCKTMLTWDATPAQPGEPEVSTPEKDSAVALTEDMVFVQCGRKVSQYCSGECAAEDIGNGNHKPQPYPKEVMDANRAAAKKVLSGKVTEFVKASGKREGTL